MKNDIVGQFV